MTTVAQFQIMNVQGDKQTDRCESYPPTTSQLKGTRLSVQKEDIRHEKARDIGSAVQEPHNGI